MESRRYPHLVAIYVFAVEDLSLLATDIPLKTPFLNRGDILAALGKSFKRIRYGTTLSGATPDHDRDGVCVV